MAVHPVLAAHGTRSHQTQDIVFFPKWFACAVDVDISLGESREFFAFGNLKMYLFLIASNNSMEKTSVFKSLHVFFLPSSWIFPIAYKRFEIPGKVMFNTSASWSCFCISPSSGLLLVGELKCFRFSGTLLSSVSKLPLLKRLNHISQTVFDGPCLP